LLDRDARAPHLLERALAVTRLELHGTNAFAQDGRPEARAHGVERGRSDAVVGRQPEHDDALDAALAQVVREPGIGLRSRPWVALGEPRVAVAAGGAALDRLRFDPQQVGMELRAPGPLDTVRGPRAPVLREVGR